MKVTDLLEARSATEAEVKKLAQEFKQEYEGETGREAFGCNLKDLHADGGNCSMITYEFCKWAKKKGYTASDLTGEVPTNKKWNDGDKGSFPSDDPPPAIASHTVARIGQWTVDFNARQFDRSLAYPRVIDIADFDEEWEKVIG
jgi:hypothetical protein